MTDLFTLPPAPKPAEAPRRDMVCHGINFRWYQRENVDAMWHAIEGGAVHPACVSATGLGKGAEIAELAARMLGRGKVLCLVDRSHLVHQLAQEIERHTGIECGRVADSDCHRIGRDIVVSTVQAMYTPNRHGVPLYDCPPFDPVRTVICDEGHKFFAERYRGVLQHFSEERGAVTPLYTATPVASNGARWSSFVDWTAQAEGPAMRTARWGINSGYLVPPRQALVKVDLDLEPIYARITKGSATDDEEDDENAGDELAQVLLDLLDDKMERAAAAFAAGVAHVAGHRQSIVFAPPRVKAAQLLASWLKNTVSCEPVWGSRVDKHDVLRRFRQGDPQIVSNVAILNEGFDHPAVSAVFICRVLNTWRMACQMIGRCMRPLRETMGALSEFDEPGQDDERRAAIAASAKPDCIVADLVGSDGKILQASAVDVLYGDLSDDTRHEIAEIVARGGEPIDRPPEGQWDGVAEEAERAKLEKQHAHLAELARRRGMAGELQATVSVEYARDDVEQRSVPPQLKRRVEPSIAMKAAFLAFTVGAYKEDHARNIADAKDAKQLQGMMFRYRNELLKANGKPDWKRADRMYPNWKAIKAAEQNLKKRGRA
jgi:superfamily II DNA or RNA helicase